MAILQFILFLHLLGGAVGQPNSRSVLSTSSLSRMVVSRSTGDVFLTDQDTVYLLPGDLSEITSNVSRTAGQTPEGMTLSKQEDNLIICWASSTPFGGGGTINDAPCVVYNSTELQTLQTVSGDSSVRVGAARGNPYLVSQGFVEDEGETFYVMSADANSLYHREYRIPDGKRASETPSYAGIVGRRYVSGTTVGNFSYFVTHNIVDSIAVVRVVRVCNIAPNPTDSFWDSWYEIQVICDQSPHVSLSDFDNVLVDADFLFPDSGADEPLLVVSVLTDVTSSPSAFCAVPLSTFDTSARNMFNYCATTTLSSNQLQFPWESGWRCDTTDTSVNITECDLQVSIGPFNRGPGRLATQLISPLPGFQVIQGLQQFLSLSTRVSSSKVFLVDDLVVVFTGFSNGKVRKYATRSFSDMNTTPAPERTWSLSSKEVKALTHASGSDYVYALTEDEVHRLPVEECSNFTDCSACITNGGLLCGWCSVENKCSRRPQCANSNSSDGLRWAQTTDKCLTVDIASAVSISGEETAYPIETSSINITLSNLPPPLTSDSEFFQCVFERFGSGNLTGISGDIYSCVVPQIPLFQDEVFQAINFTLQSSLHGIDFGLVPNGIIFYNCLVSESCSSCTSRFNCNWCPVEFQCRPSGAHCSQSPVSTSSSCPRLLPALTGDGRYYLHEGLGPQDESLVLRGENLLLPTAGFSYRCVISNTGSELMATVDANSSVTCQLPVSGIAITEAERVGGIELQWRNGTNTFVIKSSNMKQLIVLYNCGDLSGDDCSGCLGVSADYRCGYCRPNCILNSLTCGSRVIQASNFQQCGAIAVAETSPSAGPVDGSTLFTVKGTNLGAYPRENISILIGGKECEIDRERTISGTSLVCVVPPAVAASSAEVTLSRSGEPPQNIGTFRYAKPRITGITPAKGTLSGGSAVVISGENLDIGNKEGTTVYTASSTSNLNELRRNFTSVQVVSSTAISAVTGVLEENVKTGFHFVIVNIDGTDVVGSVLFQYVVPRLTSVPESRIIEAGGVAVTIIGVDVDAAVEPILTLFSGSNSAGNGTCAVQSASSLSCRVPSLPDGVGVGDQFNFSITFDQFVLYSHTEALAQPYLEITGNPTFEPFQEKYVFDSGRTIRIAGTNLHHVPESDYSVTVGGLPCTELDVREDGTAITCLPPQAVSIAGMSDLLVNVFIGSNLNETVGVLLYDVNIILTGLEERDFSGGRIRITGVNLHRIPESDYSVTVGGQPCTGLDVNEDGTAITCFPPVLAQIDAPIVVHIGTLRTVNVGSLSYAGVLFGTSMPAIFVVLVLAAIVFFIVIGCKLYKKRLSREKAQNEQLEQEVLNMQSQVTMIHGQMTEMARVRQPHPSNTYSTIDDIEVPTDSFALELNPAYKLKAAEDGPALSHNLDTEAVSLNWRTVTFETPRDGRDVDEEVDRAEGRMEDEEEDVTYYTPMDADEQEDEGVHSRAGNGGNMAQNEGDFNWGATTIDEAYGDSGRERLVGEDGERDSDEEDSSYTAYI